jgi:Clp amino terminal domain, pathogenicity island component
MRSSPDLFAGHSGDTAVACPSVRPMAGTEHLLLAMTRQSTDAFARRLLDEVGAAEPLRTRIEAVLGEG